MKRGKRDFKLLNRWLYTFIILGIFAVVGVGVYAAQQASAGGTHNYAEVGIPSCSDGQVLKWSGSAWICGTDNSGSASQWVTSGSNIYYSNGNVGIGTTSPASKLSVGGKGDADYAIYGSGSRIGVFGRSPDTGVYGNGDEYGVEGYGKDTGVHGYGKVTGVSGIGSETGVYGKGDIGVYGEDSDYRTYGALAYGSYGVYGYSYSSGVNGVGNTGVHGTGTSYDFFASGAGTDYGSSSSIRWKNNITLIDDALDKVLKLEGVYYDWNEEHGGLHDMGFIAEDVGIVVPEIVGFEDKNNASNWYTDDEGNKKLYASGVDYGALTPMLVEAIKEQQEEIDSQDEEINSLNEKLDKICSKLPSLCE